MATRSLGIMVFENKPPFQEKNFYKQLHHHATPFDLKIIVFSANAIDWNTGKVNGYFYNTACDVWQFGKFPLPDIIYDRCFYKHPLRIQPNVTANIKKLREMKPSRMLANPIAGKWSMHRIFYRHKILKHHLPVTVPYVHAGTIKKWLNIYDKAILKPVNGSRGCGIILIEKTNTGGYNAKGRDVVNRMIRHHFDSFSHVILWIKNFIQHRSYLIQQYLDLSDQHQRTYDIRVLVQKNEKGLWQFTGTAVRVGTLHSLTSNLHGGGTAMETITFLKTIFQTKLSTKLYNTICFLSSIIPPYLETYFGRLAELGIDFGVDRNGRVWIMEVNSKPGRTIFERIGNQTAQKKAVLHPLHYARYLVDRQLGG